MSIGAALGVMPNGQVRLKKATALLLVKAAGP